MQLSKLTRKSSLALMSLVLVLALALSFTAAYLWSVSNDGTPITNTFDTNDVEIDVDETTGDEYEILPGTSDPKDPSVTVTATTPTYAYVVVTDNTQGLVTWSPADGWELLESETDEETGIVTCVYYREVKPVVDEDGNKTQTEFTYDFLDDNEVHYDSTLTGTQIKNGVTAAGEDGIYLSFLGYAIQKTPFDDPAKAWLAIKASDSRFEDESIQVVDTDVKLQAALINGGVIVLSDDIEASGQLSITGGTVVLDLNGHSITNAEGFTAETLLVAGTGVDLLIIGEGSIGDPDSENNGSYALSLQNGKVTINSGSFYGTTSAVYFWGTWGEGDSLTVNGGSFYQFDPATKTATTDGEWYTVS